LPNLEEPLWLPGPESPNLPLHELHVWRVRTEEPRWTGQPGWPVTSDREEKLRTELFRQDILDRYTREVAALTGPASGLRVNVAQCDHLTLIAVSRNIRALGLDIERVREDIPFDEMAGGFFDLNSQWDLRVTWSPREKAWKFFQFWTSNEACAQAHPSAQSAHRYQVRGFSPEADFIAALAVGGGPDADVLYWDWQC
jgi:hypothetical protein